MASLPLHDAILIENGVVTRVNRIARAIEYTPELAAQFKSDGLSIALIAAAEKQGKSHRASTKAKGKSPFGGGGARSYEFGAKREKIVSVRAGARRAIAAALGVLVAYDRGVSRKREQSAQKVSGKWFGARKMESRDHRLGRVADFKARELERFASGRASLSSRLDMAGMGDLSNISLLAGDSGYHAQAVDKAWTLAKAKLRAKYPGKKKPAAYYEELTKLREMRTGSAFEGADPSRFGRVGPKELRSQRAAARAKMKPAKKGARVSANPFSDVGDLALTNPGTGVGFLDSIENSVSGIPLVGSYAAPLIAPALLGAAAAGLHAVAVPYLKGYLPEKVQPYAYSVAGAAVAVAAGLVASKAADENTRNLAGLIGGAALAFGVGYDVNNYLEERMEKKELSGLALAGLGEAPSALGAVAFGEAPSALGAVAFGDGMAYQTAPLGFDGATSGLHAAYSDASLADAYFSGPDFDAAEGEAIMAGAGAFGQAAGQPSKLAAGSKKAQSHYAGRPFHRWGWMIKEISFPAVQQIAALPPEQRLRVINELRSQALAMVARAADVAKAAALASAPIPRAPELAAQGAMAGYDMNGYGALVLAGNGY